ncbi:putative LRR containing protein, partial [Trachipleistophora hominis]
VSSFNAETTKYPQYKIYDYDVGQNSTRTETTDGMVGIRDESVALSEAEYINKKPYFTYHDAIQAENNGKKKFKVIEIPYNKILFVKLVNLTSSKITTFSPGEINTIFSHVYLIVDDNFQLMRQLFNNFQKDPQILLSLLDCHKEIRRHKRSHQASILKHQDFYSKALEQFREDVNCLITVFLYHEPNFSCLVHGRKNKSLNGASVPLRKFNVSFLFECLELDIRLLVNNVELIYEKFRYNYHNSALDIIVRGGLSPTMISDMARELPFVDFELLKTSEYNLWKLPHVNSIVLKLWNDTLTANHTYTNLLSGAYYIYYVVELIDWTPSNINEITVCLKDTLDENINRISINITHLKCDNITFNRDFIFERRYQSIALKNCKVEDTYCVTFRHKYEKISLSLTEGLFNLPEICGLSRVKLPNNEPAYLRYEIHEKDSETLFLTSVHIIGDIVMDGTLSRLSFLQTIIVNTLTIRITDTLKHIAIIYCLGKIRFVGIFAANFYIQTKSYLKIDMNDNLCKSMILVNFVVSEIIVLPEKFYKITLVNVRLIDNSCVVINGNCKEVVLNHCIGSFDLTKTHQLDQLGVIFSSNFADMLLLIGPITVGSLVLRNIPCNIIELKVFFGTFRSIKHMTIDFSSIAAKYTSLENYLANKWQEIMVRTTISENPINQPMTDDNTQNFYDETVRQVIAETFLDVIFNEAIAAGIERLKYSNVLMSNLSLKYLRRLTNLKALEAPMKSLSDDLFTYLPVSINLLDLRNSERCNDGYELSFCTLSNLINLEILFVECWLLRNIQFFDFIPVSVNILIISYQGTHISYESTTDEKIKLRILKIETSLSPIHDDDTRISNQELQHLLNQLFTRISRIYIECLAIVTPFSYFTVDVSDYKIIIGA